VTEAWRLSRNPEDGECLPLEAYARGLVKAQLTEKAHLISYDQGDLLDRV
jgi:hypothetical protein